MQMKELIETIHIGLGARHGDRLANLRSALEQLSRRRMSIERVSPVYETEPIDLPGDETLLNAAAALRTALTPRQVLDACLEVERLLGRQRSGEPAGGPDPGPRPIDLDLLLYGGRVVTADGMTIPHPRLHLRRFVLAPLAEIAPSAIHPVLGVDIQTLSARCEDEAAVRRIAPPSALWPPRGGGK